MDAQKQRDPLRAILQTGVFLLLYLVASNVLTVPLLWTGGPLVQITLTVLSGALVSTFLCRKIYGPGLLPMNGLTPDSAGLRDFLTGIATGATGVALVLVPPLFLGLAHYTPAKGGSSPTAATALFVSALILCGSVGEEMLFHGFGFQSLMKGFGPFEVIFPVGTIFGLMHSANPDANWLSTCNTMGFGILFGYAVYRTRGLWLPIGIHFGWNLALAFFGVNISGITMRVTSYEMAWNASPQISGGSYGPEASLLTTGVLALIGIFLWRYPFPRPVSMLSELQESDPV